MGAICGAWVSGLPGQPIGLDWVVLGDGSVGLGTLWGHFGDILGTCWGRFGDIEVLGPFWGLGEWAARSTHWVELGCVG